MNLPLMIFYGLAALVVAGALGAVLFKNLMHSALSLILSLFFVAGIFFMLEADFLAVVQIMLYVGGITVLILFVIMLTYRLTDKDIRQTNHQVLPAGIAGLGLIFVFLLILSKTKFVFDPGAAQDNSVVIIGKLLLTKYVLPFEAAGILLLVAMVGAILMARKEEK
ncbi:MAG: NADH-quinone oxidoreductase subunit J [Elusimicrobiota bacterium]